MSICEFWLFPIWFRGWDCGSDCSCFLVTAYIYKLLTFTRTFVFAVYGLGLVFGQRHAVLCPQSFDADTAILVSWNFFSLS